MSAAFAYADSPAARGVQHPAVAGEQGNERVECTGALRANNGWVCVSTMAASPMIPPEDHHARHVCKAEPRPLRVVVARSAAGRAVVTEIYFRGGICMGRQRVACVDQRRESWFRSRGPGGGTARVVLGCEPAG